MVRYLELICQSRLKFYLGFLNFIGDYFWIMAQVDNMVVGRIDGIDVFVNDYFFFVIVVGFGQGVKN